jgi:hypothetical protein
MDAHNEDDADREETIRHFRVFYGHAAVDPFRADPGLARNS